MSSPFASVDAFMHTVAARFDCLPVGLKAIALYIEMNRVGMMMTSITEIARACGVHPSAVTRFSKHFGFSGYAGLKRLYRDEFCAGIGTKAISCSIPSPQVPPRRHGW